MKFTILTLLAAITLGCGNAASPVVQNSAVASNTPERSRTVIAHSSENQPPPTAAPSGEKSKWTQSGDPIDTKEFDTTIASAEVALKKSPNDETAKKTVGAAYFKRAVALTDARQYASALGDYRRAVKYDPSNAEAKDWITRIIDIYGSINRAYPPEGEEPPPLPFTKGK